MDEKKKMPGASEKTPDQERSRRETESSMAEPIRLMPFHRSLEPDRQEGSVWGRRGGYGCRRCGGQREDSYENPMWQEGSLGRGMAGRGLPFYMTSPLYWEEDAAKRDLDYLVSLYPAQAKRFRNRIERFLDTMDYRGSMIYDEYPDRMALERLAATVSAQIRREEETAWKEREGCGDFSGQEGEVPSDGAHPLGERYRPQAPRSEAEWEQLGEMIQILLFLEIFRRRQGAGGRKYFLMER